jgi:hypothetical protein
MLRDDKDNYKKRKQQPNAVAAIGLSLKDVIKRQGQ